MGTSEEADADADEGTLDRSSAVVHSASKDARRKEPSIAGRLDFGGISIPLDSMPMHQVVT
jgi:hypothetical protein